MFLPANKCVPRVPEQLSNVAELSGMGLGPLFKSSLPIELTESETEFVVRCIKHTFARHLVLQVTPIPRLPS